MFTEKKRVDVENNVRKLVNSLDEEELQNFLTVMETSLKNFGSSLDVDDIIREVKNNR